MIPRSHGKYRLVGLAAICLVVAAVLIPAVPAFGRPEDDDPTKGIGGLGAAQEKVQQNKLADDLLNGKIGPAMVKALSGRKFTPWDQSVMKTHFARTRIAAGALVKRLSDNELTTLLTENNKTSDISSNPYVKLTKDGGRNSYEAQLAQKIQQSSGSLAPQDVMGLALDVCGNDYWLATITAHNLLKEITYAQREGQQAFIGLVDGTGVHDIILDPKLIAKKLIDLRPEGDPKFSDRMGPWYHAFGLFFVGGMTSGTEAQMLADLENFTRLLRAGSPPDDGKERVNTWAARLASSINGVVAKNATATRESTASHAKMPPKDLGKLSKAELQSFIDDLKAQHKALQEELVALPPSADAAGNQIRAEQKAFYQEVMRLKQEMGKRK